MPRYKIEGGQPLEGTITISGAKNAAVAIIPATLKLQGLSLNQNVPHITDVNNFLYIFNQKSASVCQRYHETVEIDCTNVGDMEPDPTLVRSIRASYYLIGAQLGRFGRSRVALPGGCNFAPRPIDQHVKGFLALGAEVEETDAYVDARAREEGLQGGRVNLDVVSVGATINIIIASVLVPGQTVIENAAKEPHIVDLANFLNTMGAKISGAGTDVIKIRGVKALRGGAYSIIPDQIEAGTYMAAVAAVGGNVLIKNVIPKHMDCISAKLREMGARVIEYDDAIRVQKVRRLRRATVKTMPYPGFPTDMQGQIGVCMTLAEGVSRITESIYETRFFAYCEELRSMGAKIQVSGKTAAITGCEELHGATVKAHDLRAGAALVIAGLAAQGETFVENIHYIERGYENLIGKLTALGAHIQRVED